MTAMQGAARARRRLDVAIALVGASLVVSPWLAGYSGDLAAAANAMIAGAAVLLAAMGATLLPRAWEEAVVLGTGAWLVASPWVIGFEARNPQRLLALVAGVAVCVLSIGVLSLVARSARD